jgi:hypothetical protein
LVLLSGRSAFFGSLSDIYQTSATNQSGKLVYPVYLVDLVYLVCSVCGKQSETSGTGETGRRD